MSAAEGFRPGEIVVGVDGSGPSRAALRWALQRAGEDGSAVCAAMVWSPVVLFAGPAPVYEPIGPVRTEYRAELDAVVADVAGSRPDVTVRAELLEGDPVDELVRRARRARMLVLGSHGRGLLRAAFLGSVGLGCARHATCPVLIVPPALVGPDDAAAVTAQPQRVGS